MPASCLPLSAVITSCQAFLWFCVPSNTVCTFFKLCGEMICRCLGKTFRVLGTAKLAVISVGSYCGSFSGLL